MSSRRVYIDWARGLAVLVMIGAHVVDAWTRAADKGTPVFRDAIFLGGFAAPLFLWLAGLGVAMSAARTTRERGRVAAVEAVCRRGVEIFLLAFLFRLQGFLVSPGSPAIAIFRVDILNIMGPGIAAAGLVWGLSASTPGLVTAYALLAAGIAMVTPLVRAAAFVDALPMWVQWYVRPTPGYTTFTAFPWVGFVFAGAAVGTIAAASERASGEKRLHGGFLAAGAALIALGWYASLQPTIYPDSSFWTSSPTWFAIRLGVMMVLLSALYVASRLAARLNVGCRPLARFGRSSLFVYWIHVELVYGYASWLWRGRLPFWATLTAYVFFAWAMYGLVVLRDSVVDSRFWQIPKLNKTARASRVQSDA